VGEKLEASIDVVGVEGQRVTRQQVADRTVIIGATVGHWAVASRRPAAAPRLGFGRQGDQLKTQLRHGVTNLAVAGVNAGHQTRSGRGTLDVGDRVAY